MSAQISGVEPEVRHTAIAAELSLDPPASKLFDHGFMARLDSPGHARALGATPWDPVPVTYARPAVAP